MARHKISEAEAIIIAAIIGILGVIIGGIFVLAAAYIQKGTPTNTNPLVTIATKTLPPLQLAQTPVSRNEDWTMIIETFDGVEMVLVPTGCFMMGSEDDSDGEKPVHKVCFEKPFWLDRTEVTNRQFAQFNGEVTHSSYFSGDNRPRENVTWEEASAYCASRGAHLPTEAEWEYAARGPDALVYPWGNTFDCHLGNFDDETKQDASVIEGGTGCDRFDETAPVGSFPQSDSWVGALDLSGNVWEWVADWYSSDYYGTLAGGAINPAGPPAGTTRVLRGGSWGNGVADLFRASFRGWNDPGNWYGDIGFRCARSISD